MNLVQDIRSTTVAWPAKDIYDMDAILDFLISALEESEPPISHISISTLAPRDLYRSVIS